MTLSNDEIQAIRPIIARALHVATPDTPLIDCAALANRVIDDALDGDTRCIDVLLAALRGVLLASQEAEAEGKVAS